MSSRPIYERLIDFTLGDMPPDEAREMEALLAGDEVLREEAARMKRNIALVRAVPDTEISESALSRLFVAAHSPNAQPELATINAMPQAEHGRRLESASRGAWFYAWRVAAAVVISAAVLIGVSRMPEGPQAVVATVNGPSGPVMVHDGELVESPIGERLTVSLPSGEVLLDGGSALRVHGAGDYAQPEIEVVRGRAVLSASSAPLNATVAEQRLNIEPGASLALSYEQPFQRISDDGRVVEVQRLKIADAAKLGAETYRIKIDTAGLPTEVSDRRVSFTGADMSAELFVASLVDASSRFGVSEVPLNQRDVKLVYTGSSDSGEGLDKAVLDIALLKGGATVSREGQTTRLSVSGANAFSASSNEGIKTDSRSADALARAVVWAGGMKNPAIDSRLRDVSTRAGSLPAGSVIHSDRLVLRKAETGADERVFLLGGPEFTFPLPGDRKGRLVGLMSTGAEFEVQGEIKREFIPLSSLGK